MISSKVQTGVLATVFMFLAASVALAGSDIRTERVQEEQAFATPPWLPADEATMRPRGDSPAS